MNTRNRLDIYQSVTDNMIELLEDGVRPWSPSWTDQNPGLPTRATGEAYRGINILILWAAQCRRQFRSPKWMTFNQARTHGGNVKKGERGQMVVYFSTIERQDTASGKDVRIPFVRHYTVFNLDQLEAMPDAFAPRDADPDTTEPMEPNAADQVLYASGATIQHGAHFAAYHPSADTISMPDFTAFRDADAYTTTLAHELIHWTGAASRLDRSFEKINSNESVALEELTAELGAAFVCAALDTAAKERSDHADYIGSWLKVLKSDNRAILRIAAKAQAAADFIQHVESPQ